MIRKEEDEGLTQSDVLTLGVEGYLWAKVENSRTQE